MENKILDSRDKKKEIKNTLHLLKVVLSGKVP